MPHRNVLPIVLLCCTICPLGQAQVTIYLDPLSSVNAFSTAIRGGSGHAADQLIAVLSQDKIIKVFKTANLSERASLPVGTVPVTSILFSRFGSVLYSAGVTGQIDRWDISTGRNLGALTVSAGTVLSMVETPEQRLLLAGIDKSVSLVDAVSGKRLSAIGPFDDDIVSVGVDSSGSKALVVTANGSIHCFGLPGLIELNKSNTQGRVLRATFSTNGRWIAIASPEGKVKLWDVGALTVRYSFDESHRPMTALAFDPKDRWLLAASADSMVRVYDLSHHSLIKSFHAEDGYVSVASFASAELLWAGTTKGVLRTWAVRETPSDTIPPVITLTSPDGPTRMYGTSTQLKGVVRDQNKISAVLLERGSGKLQIVDVLEKDRVAGMTTSGFVVDGKLDNLGENVFVIRAVDESGNVGRARVSVQRLSAEQAVEITDPPNNFEADKVSIKLQFKLWCEAASYRLSVNMQDVSEKSNLQQKQLGQEFSEELPLVIGYNQIQLNVVTKRGEKISKGWAVNRKMYGAITVAPNTKPQLAPKERGVEPQLWAVVVGVSEYASKAIPPLRFADRDAMAFAEFLQKPEGGGFQPDHMRILINKDATLPNIKEALVEFLSHAIDKDLVMIFFAGHGAPDPARPLNLFMLTHDTDPSRLGTTAYPMWEMQTLLTRQLSAKRIIVFSDACHSGAISVDFAARGVNATESNLVNQYLSDLGKSKEGIVVFTASAAGELSQEIPELGHGVFTYYLLEGMKGSADLNNDYTVTINELMQYVEDQVKRKTKGAQNPTRSQTLFDKDLTISKIAHH